MKRALRPHLKIRSVIREPIAVAVTAQPRYFADRLLVAVRHLHPCRTLQHTAHKSYIHAASVPNYHVLKSTGQYGERPAQLYAEASG